MDYLIKVNIFLIFVCLLGIVIIGSLMFHINSLSETINTEVQGIDKKCPDCPETKCPDMKCPSCPETKCPDMKCPSHKYPELKCPECPECPDCSINQAQGSHPKEDDKNKDKDKNKDRNKDRNTREINAHEITPPIVNQQCPSVQDIVSGIFPGRNPKVVDGGRYFEIDAYNTYDGLSNSNFYENNYKFPMNRILKPDVPLRDYNIGGEDEINNSVENRSIDTNQNKPMARNIPIPYNTNSSVNYMESSISGGEELRLQPTSKGSQQSVSMGGEGDWFDHGGPTAANDGTSLYSSPGGGGRSGGRSGGSDPSPTPNIVSSHVDDYIIGHVTYSTNPPSDTEIQTRVADYFNQHLTKTIKVSDVIITATSGKKKEFKFVCGEDCRKDH